ncbi:MAG TPA: MurR/RpiR family transcriptional regulator [Conexibacter sp.]|nr:MurR/RpiR family transcriptional regulator [Conexibacter sp.]
MLQQAPGAGANGSTQRGRAVLLAHVDGSLPPLHGAEERVAQLLLQQPTRAIFCSVAELAALASTSGATVVRCAQKLGFKGFHHLKLSLAEELADSASALVPVRAKRDPRLAALAQITAAGAATVRDAAALVDADVFDATVAALDLARRVLVVGVGSSAALCQDAAARFTAIGLHAEAPADVHDQHVRARLLNAEDVCLVLSHTGASRETLSTAHAASESGARTVALTSFATSPLTELVDLAIVAGTRAVALHLEPLATRLAHLALLDSLVVAVAQRSEPRTRRALARQAHNADGRLEAS